MGSAPAVFLNQVKDDERSSARMELVELSPGFRSAGGVGTEGFVASGSARGRNRAGLGMRNRATYSATAGTGAAWTCVWRGPFPQHGAHSEGTVAARRESQGP